MTPSRHISSRCSERRRGDSSSPYYLLQCAGAMPGGISVAHIFARFYRASFPEPFLLRDSVSTMPSFSGCRDTFYSPSLQYIFLTLIRIPS
jgi:hypothetical protein